MVSAHLHYVAVWKTALWARRLVCVYLGLPSVFLYTLPIDPLLRPNLSLFRKENIAESSKSPQQPDYSCEQITVMLPENLMNLMKMKRGMIML